MLSVLAHDEHSVRARRLMRRPGEHLLSSLSHAESVSVLARAQPLLSPALLDRTHTALARRWRATPVVPERDVVAELASRHRLRGADLWHLAAAAALRDTLRSLHVVTYDGALAEAARAEGFTVDE